MRTRQRADNTKRPVTHGRIAFISTPQFRKEHATVLAEFVYRRLYSLCRAFEVLSTERTYAHVVKIVRKLPRKLHRELIAQDMGFVNLTEHDLARWRQVILGALRPAKASVQGMIEIAFELVECRLDAVIHLTDWEDMSAKPDTAVLWREANVHNVPIAADVHTASSYIEAWNARLARTAASQPLFRRRPAPLEPPLVGIGTEHRVLAMIAHDAMKLEMCRFVVENAATVFDQFDYVLATGTTGVWIRRFLEAAKRGSHEVKRVRLCNSGPYGGDVQIAYAVVNELCGKIIFFQDPQASHPHDSDIRLFEQAVLSSRWKVELATNSESARFLLGP